MQTSTLLQPLLLLCLVAVGIDAYVYSCEEVKYRWINSNIELNTTFACVFTQEGYSKWDQLKKIALAGYGTSLADIADPSGCLEKKPSDPSWSLLADPSVNLDCSQEFTFVLTSDAPRFQTPTKAPRKRRMTYPETFVQPRAFTWYHTESCEGDGDITFYTGVGLGEQEERYALKTWQCWNIPDWIFSFDVVNTISVADGVVLSLEYCNDRGTSYYPTVVEKGDNIVVLTSGRADDIQNLKARDDNRAFILIGEWNDLTEVSMNMQINLDHDNSGYVSLQKTWGGPYYNFDNGNSSENFKTDYFEVRWEPSGKDAAEIDTSRDNVYVDIWVGPKHPKTPPTTKMTTARPTSPPTPDADGAYCKCGVDKFDSPVGWKYNDIWLDVVVILDTSEAMGAKSLADATALIQSFIGDAKGNVDYLITDTTAPFYTRVGVIAMADTAQVLYNLNMTKTDKVQASIMKGVKQINVVDAFTAAQKMLTDSPSRVNARQVIYYLTDTDPTNSLSQLNKFKATGIVIVNNYLQAGEHEKNGLKDLASTGYYSSDTNYMLTLQSFCKANCYCRSTKDALAGADPAMPSAGGCYRSSAASAPFSKAKATCATDGGIIAVVHDEEKAQFLQQQVAATKSDYYWIGYEKSSDNFWRWEDQMRIMKNILIALLSLFPHDDVEEAFSTDPYTNWDVNEPSSAAVATCAYVDKTKTNLPWGASNCQVGFPYVCEFSPCAVGNKNC